MHIYEMYILFVDDFDATRFTLQNHQTFLPRLCLSLCQKGKTTQVVCFWPDVPLLLNTESCMKNEVSVKSDTS